MSLYGCFNREPFTPVMRVQNGYATSYVHDIPSGKTTPAGEVRVLIDVPLRTAYYDCQYTRSKKTNGDRECNGCKWKSNNPDLEV